MEKHPEKSVPAKDVHDGVKLLDSGVNFVGEQVSYPPGKARIRSVLATMAPGQKTGWHKHGVPTYGYILEGQITVDYGDGGKTTYRAGEGVLEAMDYWHEGVGSEPINLFEMVNRICADTRSKTAGRYLSFKVLRQSSPCKSD